MTPFQKVESQVFDSIPITTKYSLLNLLYLIAISDADDSKGELEKELQFLNAYVMLLSVRSDDCLAYLEKHGPERMVYDLQTLTQSQKETLTEI
jgi:hypothetical protein